MTRNEEFDSVFDSAGNKIYDIGNNHIPQARLDISNVTWSDLSISQSDVNVSHLGSADSDLDMDGFKVTSIDVLAFDNGDKRIESGGDGNGSINLRDTAAGTNKVSVVENGDVEVRAAVDILNSDDFKDNGSTFMSLDGFGNPTFPNTIFTNEIIRNRVDISSNTTLDGTEYCVSVDSSGGTVTVTLPDLGGGADGQEVRIKRNGSNNVTVEGNGSDTVDDSSSLTLGSDNDSVTLIYNNGNTDWEVY